MIDKVNHFERVNKTIEKLTDYNVNNLTKKTVYQAERILEYVGEGLFKNDRDGYIVLSETLNEKITKIEVRKRQLEKGNEINL